MATIGSVPPDARCIGVVLAGGSARRLGGVPKGLLEVGGARIVDRVARALRASCDALVLSANDPRADEWLPADALIPDLHQGTGPLAGLQAALEAFGRPVLLVAWDMPFVSAALLHELRRRGESDRTAFAVVPESAGGRLEPLCGWYDPACGPVLHSRLLAGERRVRDIVASLPGVRRMAVSEVRRFGDPARLLSSMNTPEELERGRTTPGARLPGKDLG